VGFEGFPGEIQRAHIVIRLQIEHGGDAGFLPESLNIINAPGKRTDEK
jgi:hypothetical protein